jgi:hypothetical protein
VPQAVAEVTDDLGFFYLCDELFWAVIIVARHGTDVPDLWAADVIEFHNGWRILLPTVHARTVFTGEEDLTLQCAEGLVAVAGASLDVLTIALIVQARRGLLILRIRVRRHPSE